MALPPAPLRLLPPLRPVRLPAWWWSWAVCGFMAAILTLARLGDPGAATEARFRVLAAAGVWPAAIAQQGTVGGYPWDAVLLLPFSWLHGSWAPFSAFVWLTLAGRVAAELAGRWWGNARAGLFCGGLWLFVASTLLPAGDTAGLLVFVLLPLCWALWIRSFERGAGTLLAAGAATGVLVSLSAVEARGAFFLLAVTAAVAARQVGVTAVAARVAGLLAIAVLMALPGLALVDPVESGRLVLGPAIVAFGLAGGLMCRRAAPRALLPLLGVLAGLGPLPGDAVAALACLVLGGAAATRTDQALGGWLDGRRGALANT